jgi:hypothetical protein
VFDHQELARRLQEQESEDNVSKLNRDRLLAIETQDKELARLLQEKERVKARRARERAKQKAAMKKMQQQQQQHVDETLCDVKTAEVVSLPSTGEQPSRPTDLPLKNKCKPRYPDPEEIVELSNDLSNIAMAIDPTYSKQSSSGQKQRVDDVVDNSPDISLPDPELVDDLNVPPYMPIQGHRRLPDKKTKSKDSCRQQ